MGALEAMPKEAIDGGLVEDILQKMRDGDDEGLINLFVDDLFCLQDIIDDCCHEWRALIVAFLTAGMFNLISVFSDVIAILTGTFASSISVDDVPYQLVCVYAIDLFLFSVGVLFVVFFLGLGAILTQRMNDLAIETAEVMRNMKVAPSKVAVAFPYMVTGGRASGLGFKIHSHAVTWDYVTGFLSALVTILGFAMSAAPGTSSAAKDTHVQFRRRR